MHNAKVPFLVVRLAFQLTRYWILYPSILVGPKNALE